MVRGIRLRLRCLRRKVRNDECGMMSDEWGREVMKEEEWKMKRGMMSEE